MDEILDINFHLPAAKSSIANQLLFGPSHSFHYVKSQTAYDDGQAEVAISVPAEGQSYIKHSFMVF